MADTPIWKGLFEWSMKHQDGTTPSQGPQPMSEKDKQWLEAAVSAQTMDINARMKVIKQQLDTGERGGARTHVDQSTSSQDTPNTLSNEQRAALLDELIEIVEHIDHARDLQTIGGLPTLLKLLEDPCAVVRAKSAEVVATCAQNNPPVQAWMLQGGVLPHLLVLLDDGDATCRVKALLALSCMVRGSEATLAQFSTMHVIPKLVTLLGTQQPARVHRKVLQLLQYVFNESPRDAVASMTPDSVQHVADHVRQLAGAPDDSNGHASDTQEMGKAALDLLAQLATVQELQPRLDCPEVQAVLQAVEAAHTCQVDEDGRQEVVARVQRVRAGLRAPPVTSGSAPGGLQMVVVKKRP